MINLTGDRLCVGLGEDRTWELSPGGLMRGRQEIASDRSDEGEAEIVSGRGDEGEAEIVSG